DTSSLLPSQVPLRLSISAYFLKIQAWMKTEGCNPGLQLAYMAMMEQSFKQTWLCLHRGLIT
ncbi:MULTISPECIES: hypothetical protein, partial [unclassified Legionella]